MREKVLQFWINPAYRFIGLGILLFSLLYSLYFLYIQPFTGLDRALSINLVQLSHPLLRLLGYDSEIIFESDYVVLAIKGSHGVWVGDPCNGFKVFMVYSIFLLALPGPVLKKLWYIPLGILILHLVNAIRIAVLAIIAYYKPLYLDFNHNYTFTIIVYSVVFVLWYNWVKKLRKLS